MNNIGALIIGKSPRNELNNELNKLGVSSYDIEIRGALDGLKDSEVHLLKPKNLSDHLFTVMPNGNTVTISKESVIEIGAIQIEKLIKDKYKNIILLCTGSFPIWKKKYNIMNCLKLDVKSKVIPVINKKIIRWLKRWYCVHCKFYNSR